MIRFLIGATLLFTGCMLIATAPITVVGLPVGLAVFAVGFELMVGGTNRRTRESGKGA